MKPSSKRNSYIVLFAIFLWFVFTMNFLVINRYAYSASGVINYLSMYVAIITFLIIAAYWIKVISTQKSKEFIVYLLLLLLPPGMGGIGFYTVYAIGATLTQVVNIAAENKWFLVTITSKKVNDYVSAGGCEYFISLKIDIDGNSKEINNHCVNEQAFYYFSINGEYLAQGATSIFGTLIYKIDNQTIKTIPSLRRL